MAMWMGGDVGVRAVSLKVMGRYGGSAASSSWRVVWFIWVRVGVYLFYYVKVI